LALIALSRNRLLLSACFVYTMILEWVGTAIGNWRWAAQVPLVGLHSANPPAGVGILYILLDLIVVGITAGVARSRSREGAGWMFVVRAPDWIRDQGMRGTSRRLWWVLISIIVSPDDRKRTASRARPPARRALTAIAARAPRRTDRHARGAARRRRRCADRR